MRQAWQSHFAAAASNSEDMVYITAETALVMAYDQAVETTTQTSKRCEVVVVCSEWIVCLGTNARGKHLNPSIRHHSAQEAAPLRPTQARYMEQASSGRIQNPSVQELCGF
jgi:hypothetical protein